MQNLAHVVEFMPYWAGEINKLVAEPGRNLGALTRMKDVCGVSNSCQIDIFMLCYLIDICR